jgi:hypothetical protein
VLEIRLTNNFHDITKIIYSAIIRKIEYYAYAHWHVPMHACSLLRGNEHMPEHARTLQRACAPNMRSGTWPHARTLARLYRIVNILTESCHVF